MVESEKVNDENQLTAASPQNSHLNFGFVQKLLITYWRSLYIAVAKSVFTTAIFDFMSED